jgi:hypothetical protein
MEALNLIEPSEWPTRRAELSEGELRYLFTGRGFKLSRTAKRVMEAHPYTATAPSGEQCGPLTPELAEALGRVLNCESALRFILQEAWARLK